MPASTREKWPRQLLKRRRYFPTDPETQTLHALSSCAETATEKISIVFVFVVMQRTAFPNDKDQQRN